MFLYLDIIYSRSILVKKTSFELYNDLYKFTELYK